MCPLTPRERHKAMRKVPVQIMLIVFMLFLLSSSTFATDERKFSTTVEVRIVAPESIKGLITSYINRELRALHDVKIVDHEPMEPLFFWYDIEEINKLIRREAEWKISVLAMELETKGGHKTGFVFSTIILEALDYEGVDSMLWISGASESIRCEVQRLTFPVYKYPGHYVNVGSNDALQRISKEIVATFDADYLEKEREFFRYYEKRLEESKKK
jgi:hypothetical protein